MLPALLQRRLLPLFCTLLLLGVLIPTQAQAPANSSCVLRVPANAPAASSALALLDDPQLLLGARLVLGSAGELVDYLPRLLGNERPMTYLLALHATDELRPSGGLLKQMLLLHLDQGVPTVQFVRLNDASVTGAWDWVESGRRIVPPQPLERYMGIGAWVMTDANWWLDYGDTAHQIRSFWETVGCTPIDGVISINDEAVSTLLNAMGGVQLSNGQQLTGDDIKDYVIQQFYVGEDWTWISRQAQVGANLAETVINTLITLPPERLPNLLVAALSELQSRDITISLDDADIAPILQRLHFDGSLRADDVSDFVYLAESNVSFSKISPMIEHALAYEATLDSAGTLSSNLTVTVSNNYALENRVLGYPDSYYDGALWDYSLRDFYRSEGYYGGYTRLALPENAQVAMAAGYDQTLRTVQRRTPLTVVGGYIGLEAGETQTLNFAWSQSRETQTRPEPFRLVVQHQPGLPPAPLSVTLRYPVSMAPADSDPTLDPNDSTLALMTWETTLDRDRVFSLDLSAP